MQHLLQLARQHHRVVVVVTTPAPDILAQRIAVGNTQRQRRDADAHEQMPQLGGQRAHHPVEALLGQMRRDHSYQAPPLAGPRGCQMPDFDDRLGRGELGEIRDWMKAAVHEKGSLLTTDALVKSATGAPLGASALLRHLERRYLA